MPARTEGSATTAAKRFELPVLNFNFASLTEGTEIPPPLPSPIAEEPPEPKEPKATTEAAAKKEDGVSNGAGTSSKINGAQSSGDGKDPATNTLPPPINPGIKGLKRPADDVPASPTLSTGRPGSIRRLFSRNRLNSAYANADTQGQQDLTASSILRPESRSNGSLMDERKLKRSSGWFRRLRGGGPGSINGDSPVTKRASLLFDDVKKIEPKKPAGPPPPMIPELGELKAKVDLNDEGSLGSDLFRNIK